LDIRRERQISIGLGVHSVAGKKVMIAGPDFPSAQSIDDNSVASGSVTTRGQNEVEDGEDEEDEEDDEEEKKKSEDEEDGEEEPLWTSLNVRRLNLLRFRRRSDSGP
jgi:hypothetical protein